MKKTAAVILLILAAIITALVLYFTQGKKTEKPAPEPADIVCLGDSLTAGTGASPGMDYPSQLANLLGRPVLNAGVPGDTTADASKRLDGDVLSRSPKIVIVVLGMNDLLNGVPIGEIYAHLKVIIERIKETGATVVVGGIDIPGRDRGVGAMYKMLCAQTGALLVPNVLGGIIGREDLMSDMIHPNDRGYQIMAERFYVVIKDYL